jgi:hypothetical protein
MKVNKFSRAKWLAGIALGLAVMSLWLASFNTAWAHETRDVDGGKYQFRVGFIEEPAYQGLQNGLELTICTGPCVSNKDVPGTFTNGVSGAFDTLKAEVIFGKDSMPLTLVIVPFNPGKYNARFVPTRVGNYTFHIFGTLGSDKIDERFTSSPDTFDSVQSLTAIQFPDKPGFGAAETATTPAATASATTAASATTVAASSTTAAVATAAPTTAAASTTSTADLQELRQQLNAQQQQLNTAKDQAATANGLAIGGTAAGIIGILLALAALLFGRRSNRVDSAKKREPEGG